MFPTEPIFFILLIIVAVLVTRLTNLYAAGMLTGIFSLLSAGLFTMMDAVDVAFTEAAVGAGIAAVWAAVGRYLGRLFVRVDGASEEAVRAST